MKTAAMTILLAEDDEGHAQLIQRNLKRCGVTNEVVHVTDGREALDFVEARGDFANRQRHDPLLVILDIKMPVVDGIEVLKNLKSSPRTEKVPVIMLTTTDDPREVARCYELGCNVYMSKPVAYESFVEAIQRLGLFLQVVTLVREDDT